MSKAPTGLCLCVFECTFLCLILFQCFFRSTTYSELVANKGAFADFLLEYMTEDKSSEDEDELLNIKMVLEKSMGEEEFKKKQQFSRQASR